MKSFDTYSPLPHALEHYCSTDLPSINGWCTPEKAKMMMVIALTINPSLFVELGVFAGRSLFAVAMALRSLNHGIAVGVEPWSPNPCSDGLPEQDENRKWWDEKVDHSKIEMECREWVKRLGLESRIDLFKGTSNDATHIFSVTQSILGIEPIDFLHIDGNHSEKCSTEDVLNYLPFVRPGGIVVFDDVDWSSTKNAQSELTKQTTLIRNCGSFAVYSK